MESAESKVLYGDFGGEKYCKDSILVENLICIRCWEIIKAVVISEAEKIVGLYQNPEKKDEAIEILEKLAGVNKLNLKIGKKIMIADKELKLEVYDEQIFYNYSFANTVFVFLERGIP